MTAQRSPDARAGLPCEAGVAYPAPDLAATPTLVHDGGNNGLFEGVVWLDELGVLLFSDLTWLGSIPPSTVRRLAPPSTVTVLLQSAGTNGLAHTPDGTAPGSFATAAKTTSLAFGGTDHRTLYVSAGRALYAVAMNLPGTPQ